MIKDTVRMRKNILTLKALDLAGEYYANADMIARAWRFGIAPLPGLSSEADIVVTVSMKIEKKDTEARGYVLDGMIE